MEVLEDVSVCLFQVRHELAGKVFTCCSFIIKHDYKVTIYLLPHILLYMLLGCTAAEQQEVRTRSHILHTLNDEQTQHYRIYFIVCFVIYFLCTFPFGVNWQKISFRMNKVLSNQAAVTTHTSLQVTEEMLAVLTEGDGGGAARVQETASSLSQLSIQTVFSMLSHLMQWSRHILYSKPNKLNGKRKALSPPLHYNLHRLATLSNQTVLFQRVGITSGWWPS